VSVDYDELRFGRMEPGRGFLERSAKRSMRVWEHERTLEARGDGCLVVDRLSFVPRLAVPALLPRAIVGLVFSHRHRRLRRRFGGDRIDYGP
jgi:ligand-binding SRPBCC domain-containing protein